MKIVNLSLALLSLSLSACAPLAVQSDAAAPSSIKSGQFEVTQGLVLQANGKAADMLYYDENGLLVLRSGAGGSQVLNEPNEKDARRSYTILQNDGDWQYVVWRPKLIKDVPGVGIGGDKLIYFRASADGGKTFGAIKRLNDKGGAFQPVLASSGKGDVYVAYPDERTNALAYDIYLNVSHDHGESWKENDIKINGPESKMSVNPSVVVQGDRVHVSWLTRGEDSQFKIFVRSSEDRGETWAPPVAARVSIDQPVSPTLVKTARGLLLCWAEKAAVNCSTSNESGREWSEKEALNESADVAGLSLSVDGRGHAHILMAKKSEGEKSKVNMFHARSDGGRTFSTPQRISGGEPHVASTILPSIAFGADGSVMAVWVDFRYLKPVIAGNYSGDGGLTWIKDGVVLGAKKGMFNFFPSIAWADGAYYIAWQSSEKRTNAQTEIEQTQYRAGMKGVTMPAPDIARLKQRVDAFWTLREQEKYTEVFKLLDPFFREGDRATAYEKSQGSVKYHSHRFAGEPQIDGVKALVPLTYESEVPELMLKGKPISVPRQEVTIQHEWIWVDGDWYQVFRDGFGGSTLVE